MGVKVIGLLVGEVVGETIFTGMAVGGLKDGEVVEGLAVGVLVVWIDGEDVVGRTVGGYAVGLTEGDFAKGAPAGERDVCDPLDSPRNTCLKAVKLTCKYKPSFHLQASQSKSITDPNPVTGSHPGAA